MWRSPCGFICTAKTELALNSMQTRGALAVEVAKIQPQFVAFKNPLVAKMR